MNQCYKNINFEKYIIYLYTFLKIFLIMKFKQIIIIIFFKPVMMGIPTCFAKNRS